MDFVAVDVLNDAGGREQLEKLGVRTVPTVAQGTRYVNAQNLENVAEFVGLGGTGHKPLPPDVLFDRYVTINRAAQRYIRQMPGDKLDTSAIPNRHRPIRLLCHHIFCIGEAHLRCAVDGERYVNNFTSKALEDGTFSSGAELADYGEQVLSRMQTWWANNSDKSCSRPMDTFYGAISLHELFERTTWHTAQHTRQVVSLLERFGIAPDGPLSAETLAGLPLPERLWE